jgi:hypothetical protein
MMMMMRMMSVAIRGPDLTCPDDSRCSYLSHPSRHPPSSQRGAGRLRLGRFNLTGNSNDVCSLGVGMARVVG